MLDSTTRGFGTGIQELYGRYLHLARTLSRSLLWVMALLTASGCGQESAGTGWTGSPLEFRIAYNDPQEGFWAVKYRGDTIYLTPWASLTEKTCQVSSVETG